MTLAIALSIAAVSSVLAAGATPAAGQPQSLSDMFDLVRDAVISQGEVAWEGFVHEYTPAPGEPADWTYQRRIDISDISYDLANCGFDFHYRVTTNGAVSTETDAGVRLRDVRLIKLANEQALVQRRDAQSGHSARSSQIQPEIFDVDLVPKEGSEIVFSFYDLETANQVANAFEQAAALCDRGAVGGD